MDQFIRLKENQLRHTLALSVFCFANFLVISFAPSFCKSACAQAVESPSLAHGLKGDGQRLPVVLANAFQFDVVAASGANYRLFVDAPSGEAPQDGWPVVYCTDANENFGIVTQIVRRLSREQNNAIVVGIGYVGETRQDYLTQRSFDLTFPASQQWVDERLAILKDHKFGGADQFLDFLVNDLRPWVSSNYPIDNRKQILLGHSFGGLFTLYAAMTKPEAFSGYIAISPSLWWADGGFKQQEEVGFQRIAAQNPLPRFFVAVGEFEQGRLKHVVDNRPIVLNESPMIDLSRDFVARLSERNPGIAARFFVVGGAHHGSVFIPALAQGLTEILQQNSAGGRAGL